MSLFAPGTVIGERYRLVDEIGRGGMGTVWRAYDEVLDRQVAVKLMAPANGPSRPGGSLDARSGGDHLEGAQPGGSRSEDGWRRGGRLWQEARAAARLTHPHITSVFDYGGPPQSEVPYIVMELLDGRPLAERLAAGPLPRDEALVIAAQVASALAAAHRRRVVHRDVTPNNIVLTADGAKVVDFGVSTVGGAGHPQAYGTPRYIAPEVVAGGAASAAGDVYAFGVILSELLGAAATGPYEPAGERPNGQAPRSRGERPDESGDQSRPGAPAPFGELAGRCRSRDPAARPRMAELAQALARVAPATGLGAPAGAAPAGAPTGAPTGPPAGAAAAGGGRSPGTRLLTGALGAAGTLRLAGGLPMRPASEHRRLWFLLAGGVGAAAVVLLVTIAGSLVGQEPDGSGAERPATASDTDPPSPAVPGLRAMTHSAGGDPSDNTLATRFDLRSLSAEPVELSRVELRYWFSGDDGPDGFQVWCDWAELGCDHVRRQVESLTDPATGADHVLVLGFGEDAGRLGPGEETGEIQIRVNASDWSPLDETDDHSYLPATEYTTAPHVTAYIDGKLVWGTEP